ncbi:MAG: 50S ribosomal protein L10 [bacterium]|nr:50S ribosomal protein L10 [bacterium]
MAKSRAQKAEIASSLTEKFGSMKAAAFAQVSGLTMPQSDELRQKAKEQGVEVMVAKKTLLAIAAKEAGIEDFDAKVLQGSILTAFSMDDEVSAAKLVKEFGTANNDVLTAVAGVLEGKAISADEVNKLAALPSKEQLYAQLVGSINAPVSGFVNVLAGNLRGLVTALGAIRDQKEA